MSGDQTTPESGFDEERAAPDGYAVRSGHEGGTGICEASARRCSGAARRASCLETTSQHSHGLSARDPEPRCGTRSTRVLARFRGILQLLFGNCSPSAADCEGGLETRPCARGEGVAPCAEPATRRDTGAVPEVSPAMSARRDLPAASSACCPRRLRTSPWHLGKARPAVESHCSTCRGARCLSEADVRSRVGARRAAATRRCSPRGCAARCRRGGEMRTRRALCARCFSQLHTSRRQTSPSAAPSFRALPGRRACSGASAYLSAERRRLPSAMSLRPRASASALDVASPGSVSSPGASSSSKPILSPLLSPSNLLRGGGGSGSSNGPHLSPSSPSGTARGLAHSPSLASLGSAGRGRQASAEYGSPGPWEEEREESLRELAVVLGALRQVEAHKLDGTVSRPWQREGRAGRCELAHGAHVLTQSAAASPLAAAASRPRR
jgi:hypothetical protein